MTAPACPVGTGHTAQVATTELDRRWLALQAKCPQLTATSRRYLEQISVSLSASSVRVADQTLRGFCTFLADEHPHVSTFAQVGRPEIEDYKKHLVSRPGQKSDTSATANTVRQRLGCVRTFFDRIIEWDWPDAPARTPIFSIDLPIIDDPLPKFLDDAQAAALLRAASAHPDPLHRLLIHLMLRTGLRAGEVGALTSDAIITMRDGHWLRVPVGKLHNDRYIPLHPHLLELLTDWRSRHDDHGTGLLLTRGGKPVEPRQDQPDRHRRRPRRRSRARPPPPAPAHLRHPSRQPRDAHRSHRTDARPQDVADDPDLRPDREPHRR